MGDEEWVMKTFDHHSSFHLGSGLSGLGEKSSQPQYCAGYDQADAGECPSRRDIRPGFRWYGKKAIADQNQCDSHIDRDAPEG